MYLYGHYTGDVKLIKTGFLGIESFVVAGALTTGLKYAVHRGRPTEAESFGNFNGAGFSSQDVSFPSGHATSAFAVATVIATQYGDHIAVPIIAYSLASLTAAARLNDNAHWASDVFVGSAIGYFTAKTLIKIDNNKSTSKVEVAPALYGRNVGLSLTYKF
jgi:membrane-associated phospholipid phosphatase